MSQSGQKPGRAKGKSKADSFVGTDGEVELLLKVTIEYKVSKTSENRAAFARGRLDPIMTSSFSKGSVFTDHTKTRKRCFQKFPLWRAFSKSCVIGHRFQRIRVDGRPIRIEKVAFSNEDGYVWTAP